MFRFQHLFDVPTCLEFQNKQPGGHVVVVERAPKRSLLRVYKENYVLRLKRSARDHLRTTLHQKVLAIRVSL